MVNSRIAAVALLACASTTLGGCVASIAAKAAGAAVRSTQRDRPTDASETGSAQEACTARAAQHGAVRVIDIEDRGTGRVVVWGTAGEGAARQSFECRYSGKIVGFKLRPITPGG